VESEIAVETEEEMINFEDDNTVVEQAEPTPDVDMSLENDINVVDSSAEEADIQETPEQTEVMAETDDIEMPQQDMDVIEEEAQPVAVEQVAAQPVTQSENIPSAPKAPKPVKREDPRVEQARNAFDRQDFQQALMLYQAILVDDPANTAALTGRQLSQAKLRMMDRQQPMALATVRAPQLSSAQAGDVNVLLQQARQNPRNAQLALNVADAYKAMNDASNAMSWYRKALQLDVMTSSGLDRMAIYDSMAELQQ
jgi:tetratricopeptide (TPR) repeat protein